MSTSRRRKTFQPPTKTFHLLHRFCEGFDKVPHYEMLDALDGTGVDDKDLHLLQNIFRKQTASVEVGNEETDNFDVKIGARQGCVTSPLLYNTFSERMKQSIENLEGVSLAGMNINNLRYADDTVVIANSEGKLQLLMTTLKEACDTHGMEINSKKNKTEVMVVAKDPERSSIQLNDIMINQTNTFTYFGTLI